MSTTSGLRAAVSLTAVATELAMPTTSIPSPLSSPASASAKITWSSHSRTRTGFDTESSMQAERPSPDARHQFVGRLAAGVAHEVANRLAVARLIADSLVARGDLPEDVLTKLDTLAASVDEAGTLMERLSAVSGRRRAPAHLVSIDAVLHEMAPLLRAALGGRAIEISGEATAVADRADVESAVLRLVLGQRRGKVQPPLIVTIVAGTEAIDVSVGTEVVRFPSRRRA